MAVLQRGKKGSFRVYIENGSDMKAVRSLGLSGRDIGWMQDRKKVTRLVKEINQVSKTLMQRSR